MTKKEKEGKKRIIVNARSNALKQCDKELNHITNRSQCRVSVIHKAEDDLFRLDNVMKKPKLS